MFLRTLRLTAAIAMPIYFGTAVVAPTAIAAILRPRSVEVAPMLTMIAAGFSGLPLIFLACAFLEVTNRPRSVMQIQVVGATVILGGIVLVGRLDPLIACGAVDFGVLCGVTTALVLLRQTEGISVVRVLGTQARPALAGALLVGGVLLVRPLLDRGGIDHRWARLATEILTGGVAYVVGLFLFARGVVDEMLGLLRRALQRRIAKRAKA
jgi:hypothetical protein